MTYFRPTIWCVVLCTLYFSQSAYCSACPTCKKQIYNGCHIEACKCGCRSEDGLKGVIREASGRCPCPGSICDDCRRKEEEARARAAQEAKRNAIRNQIAGLQQQLNALTATGGKAALEIKLRRANTMLTQISSDPDLDTTAKSVLLGQVSSKIAELQNKLAGLEGEKDALLAKLRALEAQLNETLAK
jgi:hypothetical protein